jgi:FkbM family methyltransferase
MEDYSALAVARAKDINLNLAVGPESGVVSFYLNEIKGWSTLDKVTVQLAEGLNKKFLEVKVQSMPLREILRQHAHREIHFLKVDVEGYEEQVISSGDFLACRPWIVVLEFADLKGHYTDPAKAFHQLVEAGYCLGAFDGLNLYYYSKEKKELAKYFGTPANVFDDFIPWSEWDLKHQRDSLEKQRVELTSTIHANQQKVEKQRVDASDTLQKSQDENKRLKEQNQNMDLRLLESQLETNNLKKNIARIEASQRQLRWVLMSANPLVYLISRPLFRQFNESPPRSDVRIPSLPPLRRVGIDLMPMLPGGHNGGAKIFIVELIRQMARLAPNVEFILFFMEAEKFSDVFPSASNIRLVSMGKKECIPKSILATGLGPQADVLFCPFSAVLLQAPGVTVVSTFYDAQFRDYPRFFLAEERKQREDNYLRMLGLADGIASISDFGRDSILEKKEYPADRIQTIHLHLAGRGGLAAGDRPLPGGLRSGRYFFYPANFWRHKNHEALLTAFAMACRQGLPQDIMLIFTGAKDERTEKMRQAVRIMGLESRTRLLGFLPDEDLASVLRQSLALFFPSLYEGFGIPVVEAQAVGVPVACSRAGSLAEVAGEAALFFNPKKPKEMAEAMIRLAGDQKLRSSLILRGHENVQRFSDPEGMAKAYLDFFQQIASRPKNKVMLQGIFPDRWAGRKVKITNYNSYSVVVELAVAQPDWLNRGALWCGVKKQHWAPRFWRRVKQNKTLVMKVRLKPGQEADFKFGPAQNPPEAGKNGDLRKLSCIVLHCGLVKASGNESLLGQIEL